MEKTLADIKLVIEDLALRMFNSYNFHGVNPWKTFDGRDVPKWEELNDQVREKWVAAAKAAIHWLAEY